MEVLLTVNSMASILLSSNVNSVALSLNGSAGETPISVKIVTRDKLKEITLVEKPKVNYLSAQAKPNAHLKLIIHLTEKNFL